MERLQRGAEGGAEGPGAASGTYPLASLFLTIKAGRWTVLLSPFIHTVLRCGAVEGVPPLTR